MDACLSFCQYGCHLSVCDYRFRSSDVLYKLTFSSHNSQVKSACTQTHQPDTTHPYFTDQTPAPAFAHLNPEQIFYFSSAFVKCDSQGYTWWIAPPPSQQSFSNFLVIWCRNLPFFPPFLIFPPLDWQCASRLNSAGKAGELQKPVRLDQV